MDLKSSLSCGLNSVPPGAGSWARGTRQFLAFCSQAQMPPSTRASGLRAKGADAHSSVLLPSAVAEEVHGSAGRKTWRHGLSGPQQGVHEHTTAVVQTQHNKAQ